MAMGGGLAVSDRRYALAARKQRSVLKSAKAETAPRPNAGARQA